MKAEGLLLVGNSSPSGEENADDQKEKLKLENLISNTSIMSMTTGERQAVVEHYKKCFFDKK